MKSKESKRKFFLRNLLKGLTWLAVIVILFVLTKHNVDRDLLLKYEYLYEKQD